MEDAIVRLCFSLFVVRKTTKSAFILALRTWLGITTSKHTGFFLSTMGFCSGLTEIVELIV